MPLFFFNFISQGKVSIDDTGSEFPSLEAAYLSTYQAILEIACEKLQARRNPQTDAFEITDAQHTVLMKVSFREVLPPSRVTNLTGLCKQTRQLVSASESLLGRSRMLRADLLAEIERTGRLTSAIRDNLATLAGRRLS
ncbi:MAG: hypothetical protein WA418_25105 [Bradyrhizobium sp.]